MRLSAVTAIAVGLLCSPKDLTASGRRHAARRYQPPPTLEVPPQTRLLVVAPHPDDETLGAGGLMERVHETGGRVNVVYLTDGDGYPEGVKTEDHVESPAPTDYRGYGRQRRREARNALLALGLDKASYTFLGFPDGGLAKLMRTYWSERRAAYRSPYTKQDRPPKSEIVVPDTRYRGEDLSQELALIIADFKPTMIVVPRKEDQHADHCAAWFFLADAFTDVKRVQPDFSADVLNYIVHFYSWPFEDEETRLAPPPGLRGGVSGWLRFPLTPAETRTKRTALGKYKTQMHVMDWFLDGFARSNEVFSRPASVRVTLPIRRNVCDY
ncbi:MAG TPA: PIG-L family deacetylase [Vicinamibacterales bacterium]|nr:PIG-L family deacetylase [Vicinamibacterales bacterium]